MSTRTSPWAILLAAGSGTRLEALTRGPDGGPVPKQFCSLQGGPTLFANALERAQRVADPARVMAVVAAAHRRHFEPEVAAIAPGNVIVQPRNRGTAAGVLLPLLAICERDPRAHVVLLPTDHHVRSESILTVALDSALRATETNPDRLVLLGIQPDSPESEYGWIVPDADVGVVRRISRFTEKPEPSVARQLMDAGGLWNSFLVAGRATAFVELYARRQPELLGALARAAACPARERGRAIRAAYDELPAADFSRDVLQGSEGWLDVLEVPPCGWTDLGTPRRVAECLRSMTGGPTASRSRGSVPILSRAVRSHADLRR